MNFKLLQRINLHRNIPLFMFHTCDPTENSKVKDVDDHWLSDYNTVILDLSNFQRSGVGQNQPANNIKVTQNGKCLHSRLTFILNH